MKTLEEAGLASYPFTTVAPAEPTAIWADRSQLKSDLTRLVNGWAASPRSGIYLMWAELGAGKTHALRYIEGLCASTDTVCVALYRDVSESTTDFKSLYSQMVERIPEEELASAVRFHRQHLGESRWLSVPWLYGDRDTPQALWALAEMGSQPVGESARRWLRGERLSSREATFVGVTSSIRTSEQAQKVLGTLCGILSRDSSRTVVLLLDEFQRVGTTNQKRLREVNASIASLFNRFPRHLAIVLSYSLATSEQVRFLVTPEVLSRVSSRFELRRLTLPDAHHFVKDLLQAHSLAGVSGGCFEEDAVALIAGRISADATGGMTPRLLMQRFGAILDQALAQGRRFPISASVAERLYRASERDDLG